MKLTKQYIAGFVDGEGYLGIIRKTDKRMPLGHWYKPCLKIAQSEHASEILYLIKDRYGGNISKTRIHKNPNQKPSVMLEITNCVRIRRVLDDIQPFLLVKSGQAEILRQYISAPRQTPTNREKTDAMRSELYKQIRVLNHRGLAETE